MQTITVPQYIDIIVTIIKPITIYRVYQIIKEKNQIEKKENIFNYNFNISPIIYYGKNL